jgi:peptide/nickel transport system ATP-binding protein/oligopeptide transport system ATP-binding protein
MAILRVKNLKKYFPVTAGVFLKRSGWIYAVDGVSFSLDRGETLGIVGESGCGKTTLGRCIMGLYEPSDGAVIVKGQRISRLNSRARKQLALSLQIIFQDPFESLDQRQTVQEILEEKYRIHRKNSTGLDAEIKGLIERVGLLPESLARFPHEFSGGQRQRIGIARAISMEPEIIICDEPVSALDVSVQSKILNLLLELQATMGLTYVFISHDLSVVKHVSDRIAVMYLGKIVEMASADDLYKNAHHPYTRALLSAIPVPDPESFRDRVILTGEVPSVEHPPSGCRFHPRCPDARALCQDKKPEMVENADDSTHQTACHFFF